MKSLRDFMIYVYGKSHFCYYSGSYDAYREYFDPTGFIYKNRTALKRDLAQDLTRTEKQLKLKFNDNEGVERLRQLLDMWNYLMEI